VGDLVWCGHDAKGPGVQFLVKFIAQGMAGKGQTIVTGHGGRLLGKKNFDYGTVARSGQPLGLFHGQLPVFGLQLKRTERA